MVGRITLICVALCLVSLALAQQRCPNNCSSPNGVCLSTGTCECQIGWRGVDCSISFKQLNTLPAVEETSVAQGQWRYYGYYVGSNVAHKLKLSMEAPSAANADGDLYVRRGTATPTRTSYDYAHTGTGAVSVLEIPAQSAQTQYVVGVYGYTEVRKFKLEITTTGTVCPHDCSGHGTCDAATRVCTCNTGWHGRACNETVAMVPSGEVSERLERGNWKYYYVTIPAGTSNLNISVSQDNIGGQAGDVDLYIKKGSTPSFSSFDFADSSTRQQFFINIPSPQVGATYYIGFYGYTTTSFRWRSNSGTSTSGCPNACSGPSHGTCQQNGVCRCSNGFSTDTCGQMTRDLSLTPTPETISGLVQQNQWNYYSVTPHSSSPLTITVKHAQGQDCDLYIQRGQNPTRFDFLYRDITYSTETALTIQNPLDSAWKIGVLGFSNCQYEISASIGASSSCPAQCTQNGGQCPPANPSLCVCPNNKGGPLCQYPVASIRSGQTIQGSVAPNQWLFYRFDGPASAFSIVLHEEVEHNRAGVLWLYSSVVQTPSLTSYDWADTATGVNTHRINVEVGEFVSNAHYYIGVYGSPYAINPQNSFKLTTWAAPFKK